MLFACYGRLNVHDQLPLRRLQMPRQSAEQGRFAAAGRTENAYAFARRNREFEVADGLESVHALAERNRDMRG